MAGYKNIDDTKLTGAIFYIQKHHLLRIFTKESYISIISSYHFQKYLIVALLVVYILSVATCIRFQRKEQH